MYNSYKMIANDVFVDVTNDAQNNTHIDMLGMFSFLMCYLAHGRGPGEGDMLDQWALTQSPAHIRGIVSRHGDYI